MAEAETTDIYARHQALYSRVPVPPHVPPELVVEFDHLHPPGIEKGDVHSA